MKKLYELLYSHDVAQMPDDMRRKKNVILVVTITSTLILDILSFSIKGAQAALAGGLNYVALLLMIFYFIRQVLRSTVQTFIDTLKNQFNTQTDAYIITNISEISNMVRGKVFRTKNDHSLIMTNAEVIFNLKEFIDYIWRFWQNFPLVIANSITALILSIAILVTEFLQTGNIKLTLGLSAVLITCIVLFGILYRFRLRVRRKFRENHRKLRKENEVLMNDVKNIEPLIKDEFSYRVNLVVDNQNSKRSFEKKEIFKLNTLHVCRTLVLSLFMMSIIIFKLIHAGGIDNLTIIVLTDIIAISTVYSNILDKVASILDNFETLQNTIEDAERVKTDVDNIMEVYNFEKNAKFANSANISKITVEPFEFSYSGSNTVYTLRNITPFVLEHGRAYLVHGHTGCGKSTFMHLLIGKIRMDTAPISYGGTQEAYLASIMHESNGRLGANPVLQELIFNGDTSNFDKKRMIEILHGTHIYEDVMRNIGLTLPHDEKVLNYLNETTLEQYSSGQKQRLTIVKVLYNLNESHQIVVFDEATNALDDKTALSVLKFMADFCQKDKERIVLFVSHQVDLTKEITNGNITFVSKQFPIYDIKVEV